MVEETSTKAGPDNTTPFYLLQTTSEFDPAGQLKVEPVDDSPLARATLGPCGSAVKLAGPATFPETLLIQSLEQGQLTGIDPGSVRAFRYEEKAQALRPIWNSSLNLPERFLWAKV